MRTFRFYKVKTEGYKRGNWYIDLKWFPFSTNHLEMVCGADIFLDRLSKGEDEVFIQIGSRYKSKDYTDLLIRTNKLGFWNGAVYKPLLNKLPNSGFGKNKLWLCAVTNFVFLRYPKKIYFKVL